VQGRIFQAPEARNGKVGLVSNLTVLVINAIFIYMMISGNKGRILQLFNMEAYYSTLIKKLKDFIILSIVIGKL